MKKETMKNETMEKEKPKKIVNANKYRIHKNPHCGFQYKEFTQLSFPNVLLPGKFDTVEVETEARGSRHSYAMKTLLHPNAINYDYIDFWGNVNPYGKGKHQLFCCIYENDPGYAEKNRWVVTTGRHSHSDMSTTKFDNLEDAMKFLVNEMEKTQLKFDKILGEKTTMWDFEAIKAHNAFWDIKADVK